MEKSLLRYDGFYYCPWNGGGWENMGDYEIIFMILQFKPSNQVILILDGPEGEEEENFLEWYRGWLRGATQRNIKNWATWMMDHSAFDKYLASGLYKLKKNQIEMSFYFKDDFEDYTGNLEGRILTDGLDVSGVHPSGEKIEELLTFVAYKFGDDRNKVNLKE